MIVVAHLSDLHLGAHVDKAVAGIVAEVASFNPDLTVVSGDHTMRARPREFDQAAALIGDLPGPLLVVAGNHDLPLVSPQRLLNPYGRYRSWLGRHDRVVRLPGLTALGLHSMPRWRWKAGRVGAAQTDEIRRVFGGAPADDVRLLALHHPPEARSFAGSRRLLAALTATGTDLVLAGHTHVPEVHRWAGGPLVVTAGTATSHRVRRVPRSWSLLRISAEAVEVHERFEDPDGSWFTGRVVRF
ncbi:3',5'-cyclic AMP phosphodiesterase CpdA [Actinoplanes tereljensis]|uniref:Metallophosphoesterase n=1 Tax=Paractinoplanes tereljensis TaxID=571912 RepID=A0A919NLW3_9ACTN|nr:metallophosphoesterase [Actinoplanes tereljensis]GIF20222.1 metallophosphoesterase [Actinoplanes tereljensis]